MEEDTFFERTVLLALQSPTSFSLLRSAYDALLDALEANEQAMLEAGNDKGGGGNSEQENESELLASEQITIGRHADWLRALQVICHLLMAILDLHGQSTASSTKKTPTSQQQHMLLQQTLNRSRLLVQVMAQQHPLLVATKHDNTHTVDVPESPYTLFWQQKDTSFDHIRIFGHKTKSGLYTIDYGDSDDEEEVDGGILLTLDRQALEEEEEELIRMANTPIPPQSILQYDEVDVGLSEQERIQQEQEEVALQAKLQSEWSLEIYQEACERQLQQEQETNKRRRIS